jgi:hypothetical protein
LLHNYKFLKTIALIVSEFYWLEQACLAESNRDLLNARAIYFSITFYQNGNGKRILDGNSPYVLYLHF